MKSMKILFLFVLLLCVACGNANDQQFSPPPPDTDEPDDQPDSPQEKPLKIIRLIVLADPYKEDHWMANKAHGLQKDYTAQDIIEMIEELKPDCLERFVTGKQNPDDLVPVRAGSPPMTVLEFLNACVLAGSERCHIIPKLNLQWFAWNSEQLFWESAQNLYDLDLVHPIRTINLDVWDVYCNEVHTTAEERAAMFQRLRDIGYTEIGVNFTGNINTNDPQIDYADFNINKEDWTVNEAALERIKSYENIKYLHMYIDYPNPMADFIKLPVDRQADIYCNEIYPKQVPLGFTYVYPIIQDSWDAHEHYTLYSGPYKGNSMYDITKELLNR